MSKKILFVEDDEAFYQTFSIPLVNRGYEVTHLSEGGQVFNKALALKPDLVLLDIILPNENGLDVLKELKENEDTKNIKVIMLTNFGTDSNISKAMELGADDYFMKYNVVPSELPDKVGAVLGDTGVTGIAIN